MRLDKLDVLDNFPGFIKGEGVDEFLKELDIKFGTGTWVAGNFSDRFMTRGYFTNMPSDIISRLERVKKAGISAVTPQFTEFLDEKLEIKWELVESVRRYAEENNMTIAGVGLDLSGIPLFKLGTLTNPDTDLRNKALKMLEDSIELALSLGTDNISYWPGQDGWDYSFEVNHSRILSNFEEGLTDFANEAKKKNIVLAIEAKPKGPREGNLIIPTTHAAALMALRINQKLKSNIIGITIDYGHELMYAVDPAFTVHLINYVGVPLRTIHINTAKNHSNDEDRIAGTGNMWQFIDFLYATIVTGFNGWYILDEFTYRMSPVDAMRLSKELFANSIKKALQIYRNKEELEKAQLSGDQGAIIDLVKETIYNL